MTKEHIAFPSIEQFRHVIREVQNKARWAGKDENGEPIFDRTKPLPTLDFVGTVKLHGTNASVVIDGGEVYFQSRNNIITPESDNAGFATWASSVPVDVWKSIYPSEERVVIYGEWAGKGIQKGVAISELPRMFVIFKIRVGGNWLSVTELKNIDVSAISGVYKITDYPNTTLSIDFAAPELVQNTLKEITENVEKECPVGKAFGVSGIGEGVVWTCISEGFESSKFMFKVKGEKHSASKVKTLAAVDVEKVNSLREFAEKVVTESRCLQGMDYLREQKLEVSEKSTGAFLKWLYADVVKEEYDTITESGLESKEVGSSISKKGKEWFFDYLNKNTG